MNIRDIMSKDVVSVSPDEPAALAARLMSRHNVGALPVCAGSGALCGIITDRDITLRCTAVGHDPGSTPVQAVMTRSVITAAPEDAVGHVSRLMGQGQVRRVPVTDGGRVVGIVSLGDLAKRPAAWAESAQALSAISDNVARR